MKIMLKLGYFLLLLPVMLTGQENDPVLFSVNDQEIRVSEFNYIYTKNNQDSADYSRASLEEYLNLYTNFKLKVQAAKDIKLDTIKALQQELAGYQKQLSNSYLKDKQVTNRLTRELYDRLKEDRAVRHILLMVRENATPRDTMVKYTRALEVKRLLDEGGSFIKLARQFSEDSYSRNSGGDLGYIAAPLQNGLYALESAAYNAEKNEIVGPVRTKLGYHIVQVTDIREAYGEMEVAHILIRNSRTQGQGKKPEDRIQAIYGELQKGTAFEELAKSLSEDKATAGKGGYLGWFGINKYEKSFEDAAFKLKEDGAFSAPVKTSIGYHIIKRISKKEIESYNKMRRRLEGIVARDGRFELATQAMMNRIKEESQFREDKSIINTYTRGLNSSFYSLQWKASPLPEDGILISMKGEDPVMASDFIRYMEENQTQRVRHSRNSNVSQAVEAIYKTFVEEKCLKYEEKRLMEKYPEFKALMREYEEGILLFEITKMEVWDKAASDSLGLDNFFNSNRDKYMWDERATVKRYMVNSADEKLMKKIVKSASKKGSEATLNKFNKKEDMITFTSSVLEKGNSDLEAFSFKKGSVADLNIDPELNKSTFRVIESIAPKTKKTMEEARGFIIADYQTHLEKAWIASLKEKYSVEVDEAVFNSLVKK